MTYATQMIRPGMTAIAALLASSATPLLAQSAEPAPVVIAPPPPVAAAPAPTPAPVVQTTTPAPTVATPSTTTTTTAAEPAPTTTRTAAPARRAAARTNTTRTAAPRAATGPTLVSMSEPAPATAEVAPVPAPPLPVEAAPVAATVPAETTAPAAEASPYEDALPVAGGLALLALAGGALALRRRKTSEEFEPALETYDSDRVVPVAPVAARTPIADPVPARSYAPAFATSAAAAAGAGRLPENASRYGRHVQAAYAGPTPENPSLSLHKRLKRARFFDQRARQAAAGLATPLTPEPVLATAAATPHAAMPQMAPKTGWSVGGLRPAYSS